MRLRIDGLNTQLLGSHRTKNLRNNIRRIHSPRAKGIEISFQHFKARFDHAWRHFAMDNPGRGVAAFAHLAYSFRLC